MLASIPGGHRDEVAAQVQGRMEDLVDWYAPAQMLFGCDAKLVEFPSVAGKIAFVCPLQIIV